MKSPTPTLDHGPLRLRALSALLFGLAALIPVALLYPTPRRIAAE